MRKKIFGEKSALKVVDFYKKFFLNLIKFLDSGGETSQFIYRIVDGFGFIPTGFRLNPPRFKL